MEGSVEDANLWYVGEYGFDGLDAGHVGGIVEGCEVIALFYHVLDFVGDDYRRVEFLATVNESVAHGVNLVIRFDAADHGVGEGVEDGLYGLFVVSLSQLDSGFGAIGLFELEECIGETYFFDATLGKCFLVVDVDEFIFYR